MCEDHGRRIEFKRSLHDDSRVNRGAIDGAGEGAIKLDHAMSVVEVQATKDFVRLTRKLCDQKVFRIGRTANRFALSKLAAKFAAGALHDVVRARFEVEAVLVSVIGSLRFSLSVRAGHDVVGEKTQGSAFCRCTLALR